MLNLTWEQVHARRLAQQALQTRADKAQCLNVVSWLGGVQAQLMPAAELQLWARVQDLTPQDVQNALWQTRTLVKTWAMRGTLHLVTAEDFPLLVAARQAFTIRRPPSYYTYHGVTPEEVAAILATVPTVLSEVGLTREQLAEAVAQQAGNPKLRDVLLSGWGALLKPSAFQGDLCFGPAQGSNVTFVRPAQWIGAWASLDPQQAIGEVARRFLATYGPATVDEFARWWGIEPAQAKKVFRALDAEIVPVNVEGWEAWLLAATAERLPTQPPPSSVRLLPYFDPYTIAVARHSQALLPDEYKARVYRAQGWISPVVLVDGHIAGVWEQEKQRAQAMVKVTMFAPPPAVVEQAIEAEANRLGTFLGLPAQVAYS